MYLLVRGNARGQLRNSGENTLLITCADVLPPPSQLHFTPEAQGSQLNGNREDPGQAGCVL